MERICSQFGLGDMAVLLFYKILFMADAKYFLTLTNYTVTKEGDPEIQYSIVLYSI